jgi:GNAT superfamily N-acetyltransferase
LDIWAIASEKRFITLEGDEITAMLNLRTAMANDTPLILSLVRELAQYEREPDAILATEDDLRRDGFSANPKFHAVIAEWNTEPAGMALFFNHYSTWEGRPGIFVEDLIVRPQFRGKGIGKALMKYLARRALDEGCYGMRWEVHSWNKDGVAFYRGLGGKFRENGRVMQLKGTELKRLAELAQ